MKRINTLQLYFTNDEDNKRIVKKVLFNVNQITNVILEGEEIKIFFTNGSSWVNKGTASTDIYNDIYKLMEKGR